mgnify:CR=1 FL=1
MIGISFSERSIYKRILMNHTITELLWLLLIYSFIGWIIEAMVGSIKNKRFTNRGFSTGPFCLVYGITAALMTVTLTELMERPVFLLIGCGILATASEWIAGKTLERLDRRKWWDYSKIKWNFDGYVCLPYSLLWALLGFAALRYGNTFFLFLYSLIPPLARTILIWAVSAFVLLDTALSVAAVIHRRRARSGKDAAAGQITTTVYRAGISVIRFVEKRMEKAYPAIQERADEIRKQGRFAEGCGFYKLFWLFLIGALLGDLTETIFCRLTSGVWMSRSSLVWGPFSIVWGLAIAAATALLYKDRDRPDRHLFLIGTFLGGAYEYVCSVFTELVFGQVFWDYSEIPFNLGGRVNLLYCFFWGIAAVVWIKLLYPRFSGWIEQIPKMAGYIGTWILVIFMAADIMISAAALIRYTERDGGPAAESGWEQIIDTHFDDAKMRRIYPNAKTAS